MKLEEDDAVGMARGHAAMVRIDIRSFSKMSES
jgi:hypothetical protein